VICLVVVEQLSIKGDKMMAFIKLTRVTYEVSETNHDFGIETFKKFYLNFDEVLSFELFNKSHEFSELTLKGDLPSLLVKESMKEIIGLLHS
jgi:hypothetical protein